MPNDVALGTFELSDPEFWIAPREYRHAAFRSLRQADELVFYDEWEYEDSPLPKGPGYWAVTRYEDVWAASRNPQVFISGRGVNIGDIPQEMNEFIGSMIAMDDPRHFRLRNIVAKGFTPKQITQVEGYVRTKATSIIDRLIEQFPDGECDFVEQIAAPLPLQIICEMMGIPPEDEAQIFAWTNVILGVGDPEYVGSFEQLMGVLMSMFMYAQQLGDERRANPGDDIASVLMHAEVDGERLTSQEFGSFFILLVVAGNETTRNAIAHGMKLLTDHPDQRTTWFENYDGHLTTAVDENVRCATPVIHFRRTVTEDTVINNTKVEAGQKVVLWYNSANRDETVFPNADSFDVTRPLQPQQVGFGAGGPHFCLGANLARREIAVIFDEIRKRLPKLQISSEPDYLQSAFINGIKRMRCTWK
ncbi:MAG TPA: cytochrome P450 [Ilumatobacteraceae bacterium]|nr:cytochrome P450 [Ilumatobacteraceae bacterium]